MDTDRQPSRQDTLRKLRLYLGLLMNLEAPLQESGFDLHEAYRFALHEYDRLEALHAEARRQNTPPSGWLSAVAEVEEALFQRLNETVDQVRMHAPQHPLLPEYIAYRARWKELRDSMTPTPSLEDVPTGADSPEETSRSASEHLFGLPVGRLLELHARLSILPPINEFAPLFLAFLGGIHYYDHGGESNLGPVPGRETNIMATLGEIHFKEALDFALQSDPQQLVRTTVRLPQDRSLHCLFMGVAFVQQNPPAAVKDWLRGGKVMEKQLKLYFAMGVLAARSSAARRLVEPLRRRLPELVAAHLHPDYAPLLCLFDAAPS